MHFELASCLRTYTSYRNPSAPGWMTVVQFPTGVMMAYSSLRYRIPIQRVTGVISPGLKGPVCEDHSLSCGAEVKNRWSYTIKPTVRLHSVVLN